MNRKLIALAAALAPVLVTGIPAQEDTGSEVSLSTTGVYGATGFQAWLRSTHTGRPCGMYFGNPGLTVPANPLKPVVHVDLRTARGFTGVIGADGLFQFSSPLRNPAFPDQRLYGQGFVKLPGGKILWTEPVMLVGEAAAPAAFSDGSSRVPAEGLNQAAEDVDAVDFDRDGDLDLTLSTANGVLLFVNSGGSLTNETAARMAGAANFGGGSDAEWLDFDCDGDLDLLVISAFDPVTATPEHQLWENDGAGNLTVTSGLIPTDPIAAFDATVGDVDGDGDPDVVISAPGNAHSPNPEKTALFLNQGAPGFAFVRDTAFDTAPWNEAPKQVRAVSMGDVDNDGDLDLFLARSDTSGSHGLGPGLPNVLLLNNGLGSFTDVSATHLPAFNSSEGDNSQDSVYADVNADGYLDIVVANSVLSVPVGDSGDLLINRGAAGPGIFDDAPLPSSNPEPHFPDLSLRLGVTCGDVDGDGDRDVIIHPHEWFSGPLEIGQPALFLNQGGAQGGTIGEFQRDAAFFAAVTTTFVSPDGVLFDLDDDGDLDFYCTANGGIFNPAKVSDVLLINDLP